MLGEALKLGRIYTMHVLRSAIRYGALLLILFFGSVGGVHAATFTVDSTADTSDASAGNGTCDVGDGSCTLRAAIEEANALAGADTIEFNITGAGPHTISPATLLPTITETVTIDGTTETGTSCGDLWAGDGHTLQIHVRGDLVLDAGLSFGSGADNSSVLGLSMTNWDTHAIEITAATGITVQCNYLGLTPTGALERNDVGGISLTGATSTYLGGTAVGEGNVISGNTSYEIRLFDDSDDVEIYGNFIGANATGTYSINTNTNTDGIFWTADTIDNLTIGTTTAEGRNLIYPRDYGVTTSGDNVNNLRIVGNYFGLTRTGVAGPETMDRSINTAGTGWTDLLIQDNAIDNAAFGGEMRARVNGFEMYGNTFGTNASGTAAGAGFSADGFFIDGGSKVNSLNLQIGGTGSGQGNIFGGAGSEALRIINYDGVTLYNNYVGTNASGIDIGNNEGIKINNNVDNLVLGGTSTNQANTIANTTNSNIIVTNSFDAPMEIVGNVIHSGGDYGIELTGGITHSDFVISDNTIYGNTFDGVYVFGSNTKGVQIRRNNIYDNGQLGIDLVGTNGVDENDGLGDADVGPNNYQNFPESITSEVSGSDVTVSGELRSTASRTFTIEVFGSTTTDPTGNGEGREYIGNFQVTTDGTGLATFTDEGPFTATSTSGTYITMTATDETDLNTSEFSDAATSTVVAAETKGVSTELGAASVTEGGATTTLAVALTGEPDNDVTFTITTTDQATTSTSTLTFTTGNYSATQTIIISAIDDDIDDGNLAATTTLTASSLDSDYNGTTTSATYTVVDNDTAGTTIAPTSVTLTEGSISDTFDIVLDSEPTADVTATIMTTNQATTSVSAITFTALNWDSDVTVTMSAIDDAIAEGLHYATSTIVFTSADPNYNYMATGTVVADINDDDTAELTIDPATASVTEGGATDTFDVSLATEPTANVTITIATTDQATTSTSTLTFTPGNYSTTQEVTITAVDDAVAEGSHAATTTLTASSGDANYNGESGTVTITITDNDTPTLSISDATMEVTEGGATDSFTVALTTMPTASVTITIANDTAEATTSTSTLTFTTGNYNTPQSVTVSAIDDADIEGAHTDTLTLTASSGDGNYDGATTSVSVSITDDDVAAEEAEEDTTTSNSRSRTSRINDTVRAVFGRAPIVAPIMPELTDPEQARQELIAELEAMIATLLERIIVLLLERV